MSLAEEMRLWDLGFEAASYLASRTRYPEFVTADDVVVHAVQRGGFTPTDCCSVCPRAHLVSLGAQAYLADIGGLSVDDVLDVLP